MRSKLESRYAIYVQETEKSNMMAGLQDSEDWLYTEEGEDATKSAYVKRLDNLKAMGDPVVLRFKESEERPRASAALRESLNLYLSQAQSGDEMYTHLDEADKNKVVSSRGAFSDSTLSSLNLNRSKNVRPPLNGSTTTLLVKPRSLRMPTPSSPLPR